ncbi:response regulator [Chitinophaga barathri]|uniref:Response regulator n=1 Tax=Chitinophaga barathri TaxID=1647451 RepID=A0A3N4M9F7_9BACT|nr:response regulator [Chitinophaga barathri]RPD39955.1 response regulator [Chitinophaga barathri]
MNDNHLSVILADDDKDDCLLFKEALEELSLPTQLVTVYHGEQLMQLLNKESPLPDVLFLDLNMPRKNGFECLVEIKSSEKLKQLPVIIFSTSLEPEIVNKLHQDGAYLYIRKPNKFEQLTKLLYLALTAVAEDNSVQPSKENFVLTGNIK